MDSEKTVEVPIPDNDSLTVVGSYVLGDKVNTVSTTLSIEDFRDGRAGRMEALQRMTSIMESVHLAWTQYGPGGPSDTLRRDHAPVTPPTAISDRALGMDIISEMSDSELLEEIIGHQRAALKDLDRNKLKHHVVHLRLSRYHQTLHDEAKFDPPPFLGFLGMGGDDA